MSTGFRMYWLAIQLYNSSIIGIEVSVFLVADYTTVVCRTLSPERVCQTRVTVRGVR